MNFDPQSVRAFCFERAAYDRVSGTITLTYRFEPGPVVAEVFRFDAPAEPGPGFEHALRWLHLAAGVSYYKLALPTEMQVNGALTDAEASLFTSLYRDGLAEMAYRSGFEVPLAVSFEGGGRPNVVEASFDPGVVVPLGGGKDSLVTCELLDEGGYPFRTLSVGNSPLIKDVANAVAASHVRIDRTLAPELAHLTRGGGYNGHVPITGILAFVKLCGAFLHGYDTVIMSNERSADEPTLVTSEGYAINHQYSKSSAFESDFAAMVSESLGDSFRYFSLLRPWSELGIARRFAQTSKYDPVFSSCNANFRLSGGGRAQRWCNNCPKCRFVHLALAPFMEEQRLRTIFGSHPLDDESQIAGYEALLGLGAHKPFECVGEAGESRAAMALLCRHPDWRERPVPSMLARHDDWDRLGEPSIQRYLQARPCESVPAPFAALLDEVF